MGTRHYVKPEPKGRILIISPWNFPVILTLRPLIGALAAGNTVVVKPSEHTPSTSLVLQKLIGETFSKDVVSVVLGGPEEAAKLTAQDFDHINFTGGTEIGKLVMRAAAERLCSVTLELGGKSPVIVSRNAKIKRAANRISWGKFLNVGQVCIAPDYLLIEDEVYEEFKTEFEENIYKMFGKNPIYSDDLGKIVNIKHYDRILGLIKDAVKDGAQLHVPGGVLELGSERGKIAPCFLTNCSTDMGIMKEEVFGPVLPILTWNSQDELLDVINKNPNPLALYIFSSKRAEVDKFVENTRAGTTGINEVIIQVANPALGFGGVRASGIGRSNGKAFFDSLSNLRSFVESTSIPSALPLTFPPFTNFSLTLSRFISKWL
ncbi:MAG: aldehyde dehydrogenase family protein [Crocinitomicaceae bacterium]|nr:aldehyde dehydrogenase family protein [Crocinitomicaceae bacterium]